MAAKTTKQKNSVAPEAVAPQKGAAVKGTVVPFVKVVIAALPGTEEKMKALWAKAIGDYPFKIYTQTDNALCDLQAAVIDLEVEDNFVYVPAGTFPCQKINKGELWLPVVYVTKEGKSTYGHRLPMQFNKAQLITLFTAPDFGENDMEAFFKAASRNWTPVPVAVGYSFGNFVTQVLRGDPCENVVIEALVRKKYITTNAVGWNAIEHLIDKMLGE